MTIALIFDTETTDKTDGEIIESAWLHLPLGPCGELAPPFEPEALRFRVQRYRPSSPIKFGAMAVHHILPEELTMCPPSAEFELPAGVTHLIGHSVDFDWQAAGAPAAVKRIDTLGIARHLWEEADAYSQGALMYRLLGVTPTVRELVRAAHGALADVRMNALLLNEILAARPAVRDITSLWELSERCRIPQKIAFGKHAGTPLAQLPLDYVQWLLRQDWLDPYLRKGLMR